MNPVDFSQLVSVAGSLGRITDALADRGGNSGVGRFMIPMNNGNLVIDAPGGMVRPDGGVVPLMPREQPVRRCPGPAFEPRTGADAYAVMRDRLVAADAMDAITGVWGRHGHGQDAYLYYGAENSTTNRHANRGVGTRLSQSLRPLDALWQNIMTMETVASAIGWTLDPASTASNAVNHSITQHQLQPGSFDESKHECKNLVMRPCGKKKTSFQKWMDSLPRSYFPSSTKPRRTFFEGQWVDVCDTVQKWLEATVMKVRLAHPCKFG